LGGNRDFPSKTELNENRDNSAIYEPISMKFETQELIGMYCIKNSKPEVLTRNKIAAGPKTANTNKKIKRQSPLKQVVIGH
jgi:hypothetical protein